MQTDEMAAWTADIHARIDRQLIAAGYAPMFQPARPDDAIIAAMRADADQVRARHMRIYRR
jgi:hypothetical protein